VANSNGTCSPIQAEVIPEVFSFGPFRIVPKARLLERDGNPTSLGSRAFDLLCLLISRPGEVVSKGDLMARAWPGLTVDESSLRFHITQLRRVLSNGKDGESYVDNVPGRGYCFVAPVVCDGSMPHQASSREPVASQGFQDLPPKPGRLIGRDAALSALAEHLAARRFVTLRGPGGSARQRSPSPLHINWQAPSETASDLLT
jgi:DNA-binding winged helix-turn-helix (wHTH) protein